MYPQTITIINYIIILIADSDIYSIDIIIISAVNGEGDGGGGGDMT